MEYMTDERLIRRRESYKRFCQIYDWIALENPSPGELITKIYDMLDSYHAFKSYTNSCKVAESIELVNKDHNDRSVRDGNAF